MNHFKLMCAVSFFALAGCASKQTLISADTARSELASSTSAVFGQADRQRRLQRIALLHATLAEQQSTSDTQSLGRPLFCPATTPADFRTHLETRLTVSGYLSEIEKISKEPEDTIGFGGLLAIAVQRYQPPQSIRPDTAKIDKKLKELETQQQRCERRFDAAVSSLKPPSPTERFSLSGALAIWPDIESLLRLVVNEGAVAARVRSLRALLASEQLNREFLAAIKQIGDKQSAYARSLEMQRVNIYSTFRHLSQDVSTSSLPRFQRLQVIESIADILEKWDAIIAVDPEIIGTEIEAGFEALKVAAQSDGDAFENFFKAMTMLGEVSAKLKAIRTGLKDD